MKLQLKILSASMLAASLVSACAVTPFTDVEKTRPLQTRPTSLVVERSDTYLREVTPDESILKRKVSIYGNLSLIDALRKSLDDINIVPGDENVELDKPLKVFAQNMALEDYLGYLESVSGYDLELKQGVLTIRSFVQKEWNMAAFASRRNVKLKVGTSLKQSESGGSGGGEDVSNQIEGSFNDDEWKIIVEGANRILGASGTANTTQTGTPGQTPFVQAIRSVGTINVGGPAARVKALDAFLGNLKTNGMRQVNINVQAYDVVLKDNRGAGINWQELANIDGSINGNPLDLVFKSNTGRFDKVVSESDTLFQGGLKYTSGSVNADALFNFLSNYGDVELLNQPNVTVRNGTYAYISTGEEFTFVGEITREDQLNSGVTGGISISRAVTAIKIDSVRIGVTLAVTPRILDDGRIMLDIWPVISSQSGEDRYEVAGNEFVNPRIALNELSTEVITESGRPIQLGGFIRKAIEKNLQELPWKDRITNAVINPLFRSENNDLERRELVLTVTPTIVEGV